MRMGRASRARKLATAAAYGGGGLGAATAGFVGVLVAEAQWARRAIGLPTTDPHEADGVYAPEAGSAPAGPPIRYAMLGDSSAAGLGADHPLHTPGSLIAQGLAALTGRPVELRSAAVVGAVSSDLDAQVEGLSEWAPEVATIMIGANDVTHVVLPAVAVRHLDQAVRRLHGLGCQVVVGTAPDLGTIRPVPHPLRWVGRTWSRQLAAAQTVAVVEAGGRTVSLGDLLGTEFDAKAEAMFSADRFHPSSEGYARLAAVLLPSVAAAMGAALPEYGAEPEAAARRVVPPAYRRGRVLPVAEAAAAAADAAGTEVSGTSVAGQDRGARGRWVEVLRRPAAVIRDRLGGDSEQGGELADVGDGLRQDG